MQIPVSLSFKNLFLLYCLFASFTLFELYFRHVRMQASLVIIFSNYASRCGSAQPCFFLSFFSLFYWALFIFFFFVCVCFRSKKQTVKRKLVVCNCETCCMINLAREKKLNIVKYSKFPKSVQEHFERPLVC